MVDEAKGDRVSAEKRLADATGQVWTNLSFSRRVPVTLINKLEIQYMSIKSHHIVQYLLNSFISTLQ